MNNVPYPVHARTFITQVFYVTNSNFNHMDLLHCCIKNNILLVKPQNSYTDIHTCRIYQLDVPALDYN